MTKINYTESQIKEILDFMTNPEEFAGFLERMHELCTHQVSEYPEDGTYFALITDDVYEAINLCKHPEEAERKYREIEASVDEEDEEYNGQIEKERERQRKEEEYNDWLFNQWYDSLTPEERKKFDEKGTT